jgi:hypothetical protein
MVTCPNWCMRLILIITISSQIALSAFENIHLNQTLFPDISIENKSQFTASYISPFQQLFLNQHKIGVNWKSKNILYNVSLFSSGDKRYKENVISVGAIFNLHNFVFHKIVINNYHLSIQNYGAKRCTTIDYIIDIHANNTLVTSLNLYNIIDIQKNILTEEINRSAELKITKTLLTNQTCVASLEKWKYHPLNYKIYWVSEFNKAKVRVGFTSEPSTIVFGLGFQHNGMSFEMGGSYHSRLGVTTGVLLKF